MRLSCSATSAVWVPANTSLNLKVIIVTLRVYHAADIGHRVAAGL
jgi:hypothetical protein